MAQHPLENMTHEVCLGLPSGSVILQLSLWLKDDYDTEGNEHMAYHQLVQEMYPHATVLWLMAI